MPASGKSIIGKQIAKHLDTALYDTDVMLKEEQKMSIADMFYKFGESKFRDYESQILEVVLSKQQSVISLGGGGILTARNRQLIKHNNLVFYIELSVPTIVRNLGYSSHRPLIDSRGDRESIVSTLLDERQSLYQECADFIINADGLSVTDTANEILARVPDTQ